MTDAQIGILATAITTGLGLLGRGLVAGAKLIREGRIALANELFELRVMHAALIERDRRREIRRRRDTTPPNLRTVNPGDFAAEETTDLHEICEEQRKTLRPAATERKPRRGTHHDET